MTTKPPIFSTEEWDGLNKKQTKATKPSYTPGPWRSVYDMDGDYTIYSADDFPIATTPGTTRIEEEEANANILAAAPDMLEALKGIVGWCTHASHGGKYDLPKPLIPYVLKGQDAILKARGD